MRFICAILLFFSLTEAFAQKNTIIYGKGTYFFSLGLQSSSYSKSDILFRNSGQEVTLSGINGLSTPNKMITTSFLEQALRGTTVSVGYYMRKNISVSLGLMNHNYVLQSKNTQLKNALILNSFSLSSYPDSVLNDDATFFYQNNIAYFPLELGYIVKLMKSTYGKLRLGLYSRLGLGPLISMNQFFILENNKKTVSLSGLGVSFGSGLRFDFYNKFFIHTAITGGLFRQFKVKMRNHYESTQTLFFLNPSLTFGFLIYSSPKNECNCPSW